MKRNELTGNTLDRLLLCLMRCRSFSSFVHFGDSSKMRVVPLTLKEANSLVGSLHRHHKPVQGHRFSLGLLSDSGELVGAAICGRPVARNAGDPSEVLEVTRLVTNGEKNACSQLYGACANVAKHMGFRRIQTYILDSEPGTSLKASGWVDEGPAGGGQWRHTDGKPRRNDQPTELKHRWAKTFAKET